MKKREYKFRGLRTDSKGWVYGLPYFIKSEGKCFIINNCQSGTLKDDNTTFIGKEVIPESVGQYTGLKDLKGVDIYEGDIIKTQTVSDYNWNDDDKSKDQNYFIAFHNGTFCFFKNIADKWPCRQWKDGQNDWYGIENCESFMMEVIGNIHEHKHLLK